ncbi:hypothetical protein QX776_06670 [Alteromonadaceae bacterium BrNp21-10]|nr:hypothetical protein [Alteromonadaceae bacterium BrNp21-10]
MSDQHQDPLQQQMLKRKQRNKSPRALKRNVMTKARLVFRGQHSSFNLWQWSLGIGICSCLVILVQFMQLSSLSTESTQPVTALIPVQIHQLQQEPMKMTAATNSGPSLTFEYQQHQAAYLQTKQQTAGHHASIAKIISNKDEWVLLTCEQNILRISSLLINQLSEPAPLETSLTIGDHVNVIFAADGKIIYLNQHSSPFSC